MPAPKIIAYKGKRQLISAWAQETGLKPSTIKRRLAAGWSVERALCSPPTQPEEIAYQGRSLTVSDWATELGVSPGTIRERYRQTGALAGGQEPKLLEYNGERLTAAGWAKRLGLSPQALRQRLAAGWTIAEALSRPRPKRRRKKKAKRAIRPRGLQLEHKGKTQTVAQWAAEIGISHTRLHTRLKSGWSVADALTRPPAPNSRTARDRVAKTGSTRRYLVHDGRRDTVAGWSKRLAVPARLIYSRLQAGWSTEKALTTPGPARRGCAVCGRLDHSKGRCPHKKRAPKRCSICGQLGHNSRTCSEKSGPRSIQPEER